MLDHAFEEEEEFVGDFQFVAAQEEPGSRSLLRLALKDKLFLLLFTPLLEQLLSLEIAEVKPDHLEIDVLERLAANDLLVKLGL